MREALAFIKTRNEEKFMCSVMGYIGSRIPKEEFKLGFDMTVSRGPDMSKIEELNNNGFLGFHRLAIMGVSEEGMQPFCLDGSYVVCNGEIYGFRKLKKELIKKGYTFKSVPKENQNSNNNGSDGQKENDNNNQKNNDNNTNDKENTPTDESKKLIFTCEKDDIYAINLEVGDKIFLERNNM